MIITKTCNTCEHFPNDNHCVGCEWDKSKGENSKWELKENPIVIERKVLEQIIAEIATKLDNPHEYIVKQDAYNEIVDIINSYIKVGAPQDVIS